MAMVVKNNLAALNTVNTVDKNSNALSDSLKKLSSGMKINGAADDASGYAISERMRTQIRGLGQDIQNSQTGQSLIRVADGAVSSTVEILKTLKERAINAANDTNTDLDRATIQKEITQSLDQIDDNAMVTYNGKYLINGSQGGRVIASAHDCLVTFMSSLKSAKNSATAYDDAIKLASGGLFNDRAELEGRFLADLAGSGGGKGFLREYCGINLDNDDTGAIIGKDAGSEVVYDKDSIVPEKKNPFKDAPTGSTNIRGLTVNWPTNYSGAGGTAVQDIAKRIAGALDSQWLENTISLIDESYNLTFEDYSTRVTTMDVVFENDPGSGTLAYVSTGMPMELTVNMAYANNMRWDNPSGDTQDSVAGYLDRTIAHEMVHALMFSNFPSMMNNSTLPLYVIEGTAELVHGVDDDRETTIMNLANSVSDMRDTLSGANDNNGDYVYAGGYMLLRYLAKQSADAPPLPTMSFQTGTKANQTVQIGFGDMRATALGLRSADGRYDISVETRAKAVSSLKMFDLAVSKALKQQTYIGSVHSRLDYTTANLVTANENTAAAESVIRDADMAREYTNYAKHNVLTQSAQSMLAQANQNSSSVLSLLQ